MKIAKWLAVPFAIALVALPARAPAQVNLTVRFGTRLGPDVGVFAYSPERNGDWHANYRKWTPVTLYDVNGRYYRNSVNGSRAVIVYSYNDEYFLPPTDAGWVGMDRRYNYNRRPSADDAGRVREYAPVDRVDRRLGGELAVLGYSAERAGDWHRNYKRWTPTTVYEFKGRYYPNYADGSRAVQIYRYQNEYFLPPHDRDFQGYDRRFDYSKQPNEEDHSRGRGRP
jgi:hypothetical protein